MNMKKLLACLLCLCLSCVFPSALAAPARDLQAMDVMLDEGLKNLVNIFAAAIPEDAFGDAPATVLCAGQAPNAFLTEQALTAAVLYTLPTTSLTLADASELYRQLFTDGEFDLAAQADSLIFVTLTEDGVETHPEMIDQQGSAGARIYSAAFDGTDVTVKCDLYYMEYAIFGGFPAADVEELPEDIVTWSCNAELSLRAAPGTLFGYTLNSMEISPVYLDGNLSRWQVVENTRYEYSVNLPSILGLADDDDAHMSWQTADGGAALTIEAQEGGLDYDVAFDRFTQEHPGLAVVQERDFGYFYALTDTEFLLIFAAADLNWSYAVTLTFPLERQAEYSLYAEFIRNSFSVWGLSNG